MYMHICLYSYIWDTEKERKKRVYNLYDKLIYVHRFEGGESYHLLRE